VSKRKIDIQLNGFANDLRFGKFNQRRMNLGQRAPSTPALVATLASISKKRDELRPAIGISAVVDRVSRR